MAYIVYLTTCLANHKIYIGMHKTDNPNVFDGYIGNGVYVDKPSSYKKSKTPFQYAVNKYGVNQFIRVTLGVFNTKEEAANMEESLVTEEFIKRKDTYNIKLGGEPGCCSRIVKIYMYDLDGNFEQEFESAWACAKYLNPDSKNGSCILRAIKLGQLYYNHQFAREKLPYMKKQQASHPKKPVGAYDDAGNLVMTFESTLACVNAGYNNVSKSLKTGRKCKGYIFKYL